MFVKGYFVLFVVGVVLFNHFVLDFWGFVFVVTYIYYHIYSIINERSVGKDEY